MNSILENIYYSLPSIGKNFLISVKGYHLSWLRYGPIYKSMLPDIKKREGWEIEKVLLYQEKEFLNLYRSATKNVPYYFEKDREYPKNIDSIDELNHLPVIKKEDLRKNIDLFINEKRHKQTLEKIYTGGTTGTPLKVYFSRDDIQRRYAYFEMRVTRWGGVNPGSPSAKIGGQLIIPFKQNKPPFWVWNSALNQLYMSSYHLSEEFAKFYLEELRRRKLKVIHGYASSLYSIAYYAKEFGYNDIVFETAFNTAEPYFPHQRKLIEEVFKCRTHDHYANSEFLCLTSECNKGNMHISPEVGIIEVLDENNNRVNEGEVGNLILTGLLNYSMPLIRYNIGDVGSISYDNCICGCSFPLLKQLEGRIDDLLITKDGRRIGRLGPVFKGDMNIKEAQIIQESLENICVKVVPGKNYSVEDGEIIMKRLKERMGEMEIEIKLVEEIERTKRGKFRAVVNRLPNSSLSRTEDSK